MKNTIFTTDAPKPENVPYSQGVRTNGFIFSAQGPHIPGQGRKTVDGDVQAQTRQCIENLHAVLEAEGSDLDHVVKVTMFLTDLDNYEPMNEVYTEYFGEEFPARSTLEVSGIPFGDVVVDAVAVVDE